jgi:hydrogenase 3 maturation protease
LTGRPVVLGVGNRMRGDDAVGCIVADELLRAGHDPIPPGESGSCPKSANVIDCSNTPENYILPVADSKPSKVLVVDCCDFGGSAGDWRLFSRAQLDELSYGLLSTHTLPLTLTIEMLAMQTGADVSLLGIQPQQIEFGNDLSEEVRRRLPELVQYVRAWIAGA